jgi:hypothetical protein
MGPLVVYMVGAAAAVEQLTAHIRVVSWFWMVALTLVLAELEGPAWLSSSPL